jgi:cytochrome c biogenesis protein CcmG/thiol:disulfide interchange protein DsbE
MHKALRFLPFLLLMLLAASMALGLLQKTASDADKSSLRRYPVGSFSIATLGDKNTFSPLLWQGKVAVVNAFASWCAPCAIEHPILMALAKTGKVELYGIAWKDTPENARAWLEKRGNPYRIVGVDSKGGATVALGLSGVPETLVIDRHGNVAYNYKSALTDDMIEDVILPLVERLQHE